MNTDGNRIYAVGDIHGCRDMLGAALAFISADLEDSPHPAPVLVFLGDYTDRGPDSRGVIERLIEVRDGPLTAHFLRGNHDQFLLDYIGSGEVFPNWFSENAGGRATLASYGVGPEDGRAAAREAVGPAHRGFLEDTALAVRIDDYIFVHAGIRPGVPLADQDSYDLMWIREPFLSETDPLEGIVVHGHTPVEAMIHHGNRIAIDTGMVFGGPLSVLVLEGDRAEGLAATGRVPLLRAPRA